MNKRERRLKQNEATLICAVNHRQPWGSDEDALILEYNHVGGTMEAAFALGRSFEAVKHRRYLLHLRLAAKYIPNPPAKPLTLQEALDRRNKHLAAGGGSMSIIKVPGGHKLVDSRFIKEV